MKKLVVLGLQLAVFLLLICGQAWGAADTLQPVADGVSVDWDVEGCDGGEHYDCVDDPPGTPDENTYVYTSVNGEDEYFQFETTSLSDIDSLVRRFNGKKIGAGSGKLYTGFAYLDEGFWRWETRDSITLTDSWADYSVMDDEIYDGYAWTDEYINERRFGVLSICFDTTAWWDENWDYRMFLSCGNHDEYSTDDFLGVIDVDVTGAKFMDNGDDIRIVYQPSGAATDLGRYLIGANTSSASIYWKVQATIPLNENIGGESDYKYFLYYGNDGAGSPPTYLNTDCIDAPYSIDEYTVASYHFEEASGTIYDETANNNDGTESGGVTYAQTGKFGKCLDYDGTDDYVWVNWYVEDPPAGAITIDFWVYNARDSQAILGFNEEHPAGGTWDRGFAIDPDSKIRWKVYDGATYVATSTTVLSVDTWYHVAGVIDVPATDMRVYINGASEDTTSSVDDGYSGYTHVELLMGNGDDAGWDPSTPTYVRSYFEGKIDGLRVSNVTRTNFYHIDNEATLSLGSEETTPGAIPYLTQIFLIVYSEEEAEGSRVIIVD